MWLFFLTLFVSFSSYSTNYYILKILYLHISIAYPRVSLYIFFCNLVRSIYWLIRWFSACNGQLCVHQSGKPAHRLHLSLRSIYALNGRQTHCQPLQPDTPSYLINFKLYILYYIFCQCSISGPGFLVTKVMRVSFTSCALSRGDIYT